MITPMAERIGFCDQVFQQNIHHCCQTEFGDIVVSDTLRIKGNNPDFQKVGMMELDYQPVQKATRGQFTGIKISQATKPFDLVYEVLG